ncbi:hypothetical protein SAMN05421748_112236 [Paractinoplanes atraurantiacus]|uniref:Uncharacterized protein n=1 Tax=Paractinoplanes atraurantiacus TaxID=1036182 RepID=A0A285IVP1_9ACTN|nr:hypothetical protein SAMN05421748_112236 [Actinoplanes atraurantiacus]
MTETIDGDRSTAVTSRPDDWNQALSWPVPEPTSSSVTARAARSRSRNAALSASFHGSLVNLSRSAAARGP